MFYWILGKTMSYLGFFCILMPLVSLLATATSYDPLIVGGTEAFLGEFPWMIGIRKPTHFCGGSLIHPEWVVTAAHCGQADVSAYRLIAGDLDNTKTEWTEQKRHVIRIVNHPEYNILTRENDIALMQVWPPFRLNRFVKPIALAPVGFHPVSNTSLTTSGWGRLHEDGSLSSILMKVQVPFVNDTACRNAYGESRIKDSMICAGITGKDACQGDSGGPLMYMTGPGEKVLCGVVSFGTGCGQPEYPGVYTEISYFKTWVKEVISSPAH